MTDGPLVGTPIRERKSRAVPKVRVYAVHEPDCRWAGESTRITCKCRKQLKYFQDGKRVVRAADVDAERAEQQARELENQLASIAKGEQIAPTPTKGKTLADAIALFIDSKRGNVTEKHLSKLIFRMGEFQTYCDSQNLIALCSIQTEHILAWRNQLTDHQNTRAKKVFMVIGFFEFCVEMGWLIRNIARAKAVVVAYSDEQTPRALTDGQFAQYFASIQKLNGRSTEAERRAFASLVTLMRWTGLSLRDAVMIERAKFEKNGQGFWQLYLRRSKTNQPVYCTLAADTYAAILKGANKSGRYMFIDSIPSSEKERDNLVQVWGIKYQKLADLAQITDEQGEPIRPTSHWMRHTFVRWCLDNDMPTEDIAMLLGDTLAIVAKHYSDWITGRQERLTERMILALSK
jgi:site-specific recombinase XerD